MEIKKQVKTFLVEYQCPRCEKGLLKPTGQVLGIYPPKYRHYCNNPECDEVLNLERTYPYIDYEIIGNDS